MMAPTRIRGKTGRQNGQNRWATRVWGEFRGQATKLPWLIY
jgi:hypothetical protein